MTLNAAGQIEVTTPVGGFTDDLPVAWQEEAGGRTPVSATFDLQPQRLPRQIRDQTNASSALRLALTTRPVT